MTATKKDKTAKSLGLIFGEASLPRGLLVLMDMVGDEVAGDGDEAGDHDEASHGKPAGLGEGEVAYGASQAVAEADGGEGGRGELGRVCVKVCDHGLFGAAKGGER